MRILILDDMKERHDGFDRVLAGRGATEVFHAYRYTEALNALRNKGPWNRAYLDHDLADMDDGADFVGENYGGKVYLTGLDLCHWLADNPALAPPHIVIHSWNPDGAKNMEAVLRQIPNIQVERRMYSGA